MRSVLNNRRGFTLIEIVIAVAIVAIFAAAISPMVFRHLEDAKISKAQSEAETIATARAGLLQGRQHLAIHQRQRPHRHRIDRVPQQHHGGHRHRHRRPGRRGQLGHLRQHQAPG